MKSLQFFSNPSHFSKVDRSIITRLLEDYQKCLPPAAAALLTAGLDYDQYCAAWPAQFKNLDGFGPPLLEALFAIETLSLPENAPFLEKARATLPAPLRQKHPPVPPPPPLVLWAGLPWRLHLLKKRPFAAAAARAHLDPQGP